MFLPVVKSEKIVEYRVRGNILRFQDGMTTALGGCYIDFMSGEYKINPLEPKAWNADQDEIDKDAPPAFNKATRLSQHIAFLKDFFRTYKDFTDKLYQHMYSHEYYCQKMYTRFLDEINNRPPLTMEQIKSMWYDGGDYSYRHYDETRYHALNLHSVFNKGTIEFRLFNSSLNGAEKKRIRAGTDAPNCIALQRRALLTLSPAIPLQHNSKSTSL